jgi:hypothetical protein
MTDIIAKAICDSQRPDIDSINSRFLTIWARAPQMIHQETLRHRTIYIEDLLGTYHFDPDFSFSVSSSRAIPTYKNLQEARDPKLRAAPIFWGSEQRGMIPGPEHNELIPNTHWKHITTASLLTREELWDIQANQNADIAQAYLDAGYHKSIGNRVINHCLHTTALMSATGPGWLNFFGLRLDSGADPILRALAEAAWVVWNESRPQKLKPGQWHLPYIEDTDWEFCQDDLAPTTKDVEQLLQKVSVARCARLSYQSFTTQKRSTIEEDLELYQRLVGGRILHPPPAEHQATPDSRIQLPFMKEDPDNHGCFILDHYEPGRWINEDKTSNLGPGWLQYRKLLPNEAIAPLPEGY